MVQVLESELPSGLDGLPVENEAFQTPSGVGHVPLGCKLPLHHTLSLLDAHTYILTSSAVACEMLRFLQLPGAWPFPQSPSDMTSVQ